MQNKNTPYDPAYYSLFSCPRMIRDLLIHFVGHKWTQELNFDSLQTVSPKFVTRDLRRRESDIIWKAKWKNREYYFVLFLEFQSSIDKYISVRLLAYINLMFLDLIKQKKVQKSLPVILPMVLYNGHKKWNAGFGTNSLISPECPESLEKFQPALIFWLIDEKRIDVDFEDFDENLVAPLFAFEQASGYQEAKQIFDRFKRVIKNPELSDIRRAYAQYLVAVFKLENRPEIKTRDLDEVEIMLGDKLEQWKAHDLAEAEAKGIKQEVKQGVKQGVAKIVVAMLRKGKSIEEIASDTDIPLDTIEKISEEMKSESKS